MTDAGAPRAGSPDAEGQQCLRRYEMRIKTTLSPALIASMPVLTGSTVVPSRSIRHLRIRGDKDLGTIVARLAEYGVEVLELRVVRRCA